MKYFILTFLAALFAQAQTQPININDIKFIRSGRDHACVATDSTVLCFGREQGIVRNDENLQYSAIPSGLKNIVQASLYHHICVLD